MPGPSDSRHNFLTTSGHDIQQILGLTTFTAALMQQSSIRHALQNVELPEVIGPDDLAKALAFAVVAVLSSKIIKDLEW